ncbi:S9 family peptidase [Aliikangiella maris]|uniref:S9 family peptidase n=2 Tax=Aliikangiella maris TaxID=3162458 RepID=A0ABV3MU88_9GAMM
MSNFSDSFASSTKQLSTPVAKTKPHALVYHQHQRNDPYYWLRDDTRQNPDVIEHLAAENAYTKALLAPTEKLQQTIYQEIHDRLDPNESYVPYYKSGYWYYSQFDSDKNYLTHIRIDATTLKKSNLPSLDSLNGKIDEKNLVVEKNSSLQTSEFAKFQQTKGHHSKEQKFEVQEFDVQEFEKQESEEKLADSRFIYAALYGKNLSDIQLPYDLLIDENERAKHFDYYNLDTLQISPNQKYLAFSEDTTGRRQYQISLKPVNEQSIFTTSLQHTNGQIIWANNNKTIFFVNNHLETLRAYQVYRGDILFDKFGHIKDFVNVALVYEETDPEFTIYIGKTRSEKFITITADQTNSTEVLLIDANKPESKPEIFITRAPQHRYRVDHIQALFFIQSDNDAPNEKILTVSESQRYNKIAWDEVVPHQTNRFIQAFELFATFWVTHERIDGIEQILIRQFSGEIIDQITFQETAYTTGIAWNAQTHSTKLRYYYSSMTTPDSIYEYDIVDKKSTLLKQDKVLGQFDSQHYHSERIRFKVRDGVEVPASLVWRKDSYQINGQHPMLVYGYGAYGEIIDPCFDVSLLSLLDRGFIYVIIHPRGSKMLGQSWYEQGKLFKKHNTFHDFIDVTQALVATHYADPNRVYAQGGSAGGLLMGAIANMAPHYFHGIIAEMPFVDVLTTMLDETIPLTTLEYDEWGNPNDQSYYQYMLSYSPYDQVKKQNYPHMLVITGLHDSQVQYWEPVKWVAKLRANKTNSNMLLLDIDMTAGHHGKSGRFEYFQEIAKQFAFILHLANQ